MGRISRNLKENNSSFSTAIAILAIAISLFVGAGDGKMVVWCYTIGGVLAVGAMYLLFHTLLQKPEGEVLSIPEAVKKSSEIWGLWHTGERHLSLIKNRNYANKFKMILLLDINHKVAFTYHIRRSGSKEAKVISLVKQFTREAMGRGIEVRWHSIELKSGVTIYKPADNKESSWLVSQELTPLYKVKERGLTPVIREKEQPATYKYYVDEFERIWESKRLSRVPKANEYE